MGIKSIGFVDEKVNRFCSDLDLLGSFSDLPLLVQKYGVSHVFIALPMGRYDDVRRVFAILAQSLVDVRLVADVPDLAGLTFTTSNLDGLPLLGLRESPHFGLNIVVKRAMDIVLSLVALVVLSPVMLLIAALIKLTSPGPVFYRQERCGLNGKSFFMLKFRSMRVDAEKETGAVWARQKDDRRTGLGAFLRATSLDELPQFINVLKGDMSLVGPRPERPVFIQKFARTIPNYMARHCVKAGITGWAQVNGWRGNTSLRKRLQFDLYYITHWTPWLDIRILWLTVFKGLVNRNAY
jgi:Undecaprenyl-phosphate glucose phosphotransferase